MSAIVLFALSLEPCLATIHYNPNIHGILVGENKHKYDAYADDILLFYKQQLIISLPNLMSEFELFGSISNFMTNLSKPEILNIPVPHTATYNLKPAFPFSWQPRSLKKCVIFLTSNIAGLFKANFMPLLNLIRQDISKWKHISNSWLGRISIVKIIIYCPECSSFFK